MKNLKIRNWLAGLSLTTAFFVFQACYGPPQDFGLDVLIEGKVVSADTGDPLSGIQVASDSNYQTALTDENGEFSFYIAKDSVYAITFSDIDGEENGRYASKDTILENSDDSIFLKVDMQAEKL
jgi:putative lipoprotein (rSAM/lipoprotein system)